MRPLQTFRVVPALPAPVTRLRDVAYNVRWAWDHDAIELFRRLDSNLWETTGHNPVRMLGAIDQARLEEVSRDDSFLAHLERVSAGFERYPSGKLSWFERAYPNMNGLLVAYFSAEFGLTECLSIFAGGLGVLAGDHLKSASDLGIPLVGVGLLYQQGYFRQYLNQSGWQQEAYEENDFLNLPLEPVERDGKPVHIDVQYPGRMVRAQVWQVRVGRVSLYLLDTNLGDNRPEDRDITDQLYGGDLEMRIKQEILLGIGGCRALEALGIEPTVYHMNEGHSAFLSLERVRRLMESRGLRYDEARELASAGMTFTTHTPVEAGHDYFPPELMDRYFADYIRALGVGRAEFLGLGRRQPSNDAEPFCMTVLALRMAAFGNGVSKLHGQVSRRMWREIWPGLPVDEIPIGHVTNGVHFRSWISYEMNQLYDRYLGPNWRDEPGNGDLWKRVDSIPAEELWRTHERRRERMVSFARRRLRTQLEHRGAPPSEIAAAEEVLDPDALTIGFARRFATYKRAALLLRDPERLARILGNPERPVQIIFAGKAHPRDNPGKDLIRQVVDMARQKEFRRRIVFLEDYDMAVSRYLVQGCDVWLSTPLRPMEASGTSGMKAAANGALNLSTLDGWWDEAWQESGTHVIGWAIGSGESYTDRDYQDRVEAEALYHLLESDVVPAFYERGADHLPRKWTTRMKATLSHLCSKFNTHRMVQEYTERFYITAHARHEELAADSAARARTLAVWVGRVRAAWPQVKVTSVESAGIGQLKVGERFSVRARLQLGPLTPEDVSVELCVGPVDSRGEMTQQVASQMQSVAGDGAGAYRYEGSARACCTSGQYGFTIRILPCHVDMVGPFLPGLVAWAQEAGAPDTAKK
ncbi:MAG TPA: alpha-glucan family phosphorylase [Bryobacteraceae bacterium]|nr:alpha-glucan family phosphorylase [Bryobacteraceae bacterium]